MPNKWKAKIYKTQAGGVIYEMQGARIPFSLPENIPETPSVVKNYIRFSSMMKEMAKNKNIRYITNDEIVEFETDKDLTGYSFVIKNIMSCGKEVGSYTFVFELQAH